MDHGTRACYQRRHCRCTLCRVAEARYRACLRLRHAKALPILGSLIPASEAWARIRVLKQEGFTKQQITGWTNRIEPRLTAQQRIRLKTLLRLRSLCEQYLITDDELPNHQPYHGEEAGGAR